MFTRLSVQNGAEFRNQYWWASEKNNKVGPFPNREEAVKAMFEKFPKTKSATSGVGNEEGGPYGSLQWTNNPNINGGSRW